MRKSKAELALYGVLIAGALAGAAYDVPPWMLLAGAGVVVVAYFLLPRHLHEQDETPEDARWPWRKPWFWIVLAAIGGLGAWLSYDGAPFGLIAFICGLLVAVEGYVVARQVERVRELRSGVPKRGPTVQDWVLLGVSSVFCVLGILLVRNDWRLATVVLAIFGSCTLSFAATVRRKLREARQRDLSVTVVGGVNIYAEGQRIVPIGIGCLIVGGVLYFIGTMAPLYIRLMGAFVALVGIVVLAMISCGLLSRKFIRFEPDALIIGEQTYRLRIEWDNIASLAEIEYANNPFVALQTADIEAVEVTPAQRRERAMRDVANNRGWNEADVILQAQLFGIDAPVLAAAIARYVSEPSVRNELAVRFLAAARE